MRQFIIARKDLQMSPGKLAAQVSHASLAFLSHVIRDGEIKNRLISDDNAPELYEILIRIDSATYEDWLGGIFTKTVCEAKNRNQLLKAVAMAEELGLKEGKDFFLIKDNCLTELEPEEIDEAGVGKTLTCIGFRPLPDEIAHAISRKFHLYV